ncbi:HlyC/CorC family transporter [Guyparkeria sp.]|uniref:HlyC/CorC family transporter n=1 Tax=Guyparkeria sp. TaxID=2035736 RepID=UPI003565EFEE
MNEIPLGFLFTALAVLIVLSAFFSSSETALMALNRYRLRHLAKQGQRGAILASRLLDEPDRLIGLILLGNNFVNILASSIATVIGLRLFGDSGIAIATGAMTFLLLIFGEVAPKTAAAVFPERFAFPASFVYSFLIRPLRPVIWLINWLANGLLSIFGLHPSGAGSNALTRAELHTIVRESGQRLPDLDQSMLLSVLELGKASVEDIMIPRAEIVGIDITQDWKDVLDQLIHAPYSRLPVFEGSVEHTIGIINVRRLIGPLIDQSLTLSRLKRRVAEPYYVPEGTPLTTQLLNFQRQERRSALVVDEYGDIQGLVTLEDILEEIVGEFTTSPDSDHEGITLQDDGRYIVRGNLPIREINRELEVELPTDEASTLNGLVIEQLESLPTVGATIDLPDAHIEVRTVRKRAVDTALITTFKRGDGET